MHFFWWFVNLNEYFLQKVTSSFTDFNMHSILLKKFWGIYDCLHIKSFYCSISLLLDNHSELRRKLEFLREIVFCCCSTPYFFLFLRAINFLTLNECLSVKLIIFATFFLFLREINFRSCLRGTVWKNKNFRLIWKLFRETIDVTW